jgi:hypothetical protein
MWMLVISVALYLLPAVAVITHYALELRSLRAAIAVLNDPVLTHAVYRYPLALLDRLLPAPR